MGTAQTILSCVDVIKERLNEGKKPFAVVSAISKMTDTLLKLLELAKTKKLQEFRTIFQAISDRHYEILKEITKDKDLIDKYSYILNDKFVSLSSIFDGIFLTGDYSEKMQANILSYGEDLSSELMELALTENGIKGKKINSKYLVKTNGDYLSANVDFNKTKKCFSKLKDDIENGTVFVMTGFFGGGENDEIMLLGRGGSDYSGSIAGISLDANIVEIWTDADGVMSADPRLIPTAKSWEKMNKDIASEMARAGAKVLHPKTILASYYNIDIIIKNLFNKKFKGTLVNSELYGDGVRGIVSDNGYSIIYIENQEMYNNFGFINKIGTIATENQIFIDMIATSEISVSFTVRTKFLSNAALKALKALSKKFLMIDDITKVSVIGENVSSSCTENMVFSALNEVCINPILVSIGYSKNNIGIAVESKNKDTVLEALHKKFIK